MSERIEAGDSVMVAYGMPCCSNGERFGFVYVVSEVRPVGEPAHCKWCKADFTYDLAICAGERSGYATVRLKKLPPFVETESFKEEITA